MMDLHRIESLDLPELAPYRTMRQQVDHRGDGIFVVEGEKVVRRLFDSSFLIESLLLTEKRLPDFIPLLEKRAETIRVFIASTTILEKLTGYSFYHGVLGLAKIPGRLSSKQFVSRAKRPLLFCALDGINNAENVGAIIRNCGAFGVQGIIASKNSSSPYLRRAVRSSMGAIFDLPVMEEVDLPEIFKDLRQQGCSIIAAHAHEVKNSLWECDLTPDVCLVFGSEGFGLSDAVLKACDVAVAIPMSPRIDSLNVANAAAVFLYEARRQRATGSDKV